MCTKQILLGKLSIINIGTFYSFNKSVSGIKKKKNNNNQI